MGGALWGTYDERAESTSFQEAIREWRGGGASQAAAPASSLMRTATGAHAAAGGRGEGGAAPGAASLAPSDPSWKPSAVQCCWDCLQRFTHRGHWSSLAEKQFCSRECGEKYEESRRLKRAPPAPPKRKVACQRCYNLCSQETSVSAGSTGKYFCTKMCADLAGVGAARGRGPHPSAAPPGGAPAGRAPRSSAAAGMLPATTGSTTTTMTKGGVAGGGRSIGRFCPECEGGVDILKGAVGVVVAGLGSRLCCSRKCADAVLERPTPEDVDSSGKETNVAAAAAAAAKEAECL